MTFYPLFLIGANVIGETMWHRVWEIIGEQWALFYGSVLITTVIAMAPIWFFKVIKMNFTYPQFFTT